MKYTIIVDKQSSSNPSSEKKEYTIDIEELRTYNGISDTLTVTTETAYVTRRLQLSEYGILSVLPAPKKEELQDLNITLFEGKNYIYILNEEGNKISLSYVIKNDFTDTYPTKSDMKSSITQTAQSIELSVNQKLEGYSTTEEMNSAIKVSADNITSTVSKNYETKKDAKTQYSEIKQTTDSISSTVSNKVGKTEVISSINQSAEKIQIDANKISLKGKEINLTSDNIGINSDFFQVTPDGKVTIIDNSASTSAFNFFIRNTENQDNLLMKPNWVMLDNSGGSNRVHLYTSNHYSRISAKAGECTVATETSSGYYARTTYTDGFNNTTVAADGITTPKLNQTSLESIKKNISHYNENALETILNSDIYSYNLKTEKDTDKKHIGFVIGDKYKTPKEVMNNEGNAIELYSAIGILWKGMQEQQKKIEELENKLKEVTNG